MENGGSIVSSLFLIEGKGEGEGAADANANAAAGQSHTIKKGEEEREKWPPLLLGNNRSWVQCTALLPPSLPLPVLRVRSSGLSSNEELEEDDRTNDSDVDDVEKREVFSQRFSDGVDKGEREGKRGKEGRSPPSRQRLLAFI